MFFNEKCESNSTVECNLAKVEAEGSNPFFRFLFKGMNDRVVEGASLEN